MEGGVFLNLLSWIILGGVAGGVANAIEPSPSEGGFLGAVVLGILGAVVGGFLATLIFGIGITGFDLNSVVIATLGALLLLSLSKVVRAT